MKIVIVWTTPIENDSNMHLRKSIKNGFVDQAEISSIDSVFTVEVEELRTCDFILFIGTLLSVELFTLDLILSNVECPKYFWNIEDPYDFDYIESWLRLFDHVFTVEKTAINYYESCTASYLPLAADYESHFRKRIDAKSKKVLIVGSDYDRRHQIVSYIARNLSREYEILRVGNVNTFSDNVHYIGRLPNPTVSDFDCSSVASIIIGRDFDFHNNIKFVPAGSPGPRLFESLMSGARVIIDPYSVRLHDTPDLMPFVSSAYSMRDYIEIIENNTTYNWEVDTQQEIIFANHTYANRARTIITHFLKSKES